MRSSPLALAILLFAATALAAERAAIPGTEVSLPLPAGFAVAPDFPGIGLDEDLTSVLVTELPVPFAVAKQRFDAASLARGGVQLHRSDVIEIDGHEGLLLHATQQAAGLDFRKWLVVFGDDTDSILLAATTPLDQESHHQETLVGILRGAQWRKVDVAARALPFRIGEVPPFEVVASSRNAVVLADPRFEDGDNVAPSVTVGVSLANVQIGDLGAFARRRLEETTSIREIEITKESQAELDGMPAHRIAATAVELESDRTVLVLQLLATDGQRYFLVQGIADAVRGEIFEPRFERVGTLFTRHDPAPSTEAEQTAAERSPATE